MLYTVQLKPKPRPNVMAEKLDTIKLDLVTEYENTGHLDIGDWVARYPVHREELLEFWLWLRGTRDLPRAELEPTEALTPADIEAYEEAVRNASMAVTLGPELIKPSADPAKVDQGSTMREALATQLESLRRRPQKFNDPRASFRKAVVCTWVVSRLQKMRPRVSRLAAQKATYLLEHAMALGVFTEHDRKPLGPYDRKSRYRDAEPIASKKGWLKVRGSTLRAADDLSEMGQYVRRYLRSEDTASRFIESLAGFSDDELEVLATVHWTAREISAANQSVTSTSVAAALARTSDWSPKLERSHFTIDRIGDAIEFLRGLRLVKS